jgi:hypothetical protein
MLSQWGSLAGVSVRERIRGGFGGVGCGVKDPWEEKTVSALTWIITHTIARTLARACPHRHVQIVPRDKLHEAVPCERCGTDLPPPPICGRETAP